jgi:clan AA aspartic protease
MITGAVSTHSEALVRLAVNDTSGHPYPIEFAVDTGFNADMTLPPAVIAVLGLRRIMRQQALFADGSVQLVDKYEATITWDGQPRTVEVNAIQSKPLLGMRLLHDHELRIEVRNRRRRDNPAPALTPTNATGPRAQPAGRSHTPLVAARPSAAGPR